MKSRIQWAVVLALAGLLTGGATAQNVWKGTGTNDWYASTANWSQGHFPLAGEAVVITNKGVGVLLATAAPAAGWLDSLTTSNSAMLIFTNWTTALSATNIWVLSNSTITCSGPFTTNAGQSNRVWLICSNLAVAAGAAIDVSQKGYAGKSGGGYGPGGAPSTASRGGGGYGGRGRIPFGNGQGIAGITYGLADAPQQPGSGGTGDSQGGHGGGAIRVEAKGAVVVNGSVTSDGQGGFTGDRGCGSGGGIYITCNTFAGTNGVVRAVGGTGLNLNSTGSGGGGRVAIAYTPSAQSNQPLPAVQVSAAPGGYPSYSYGDPGTLSFPDMLWITETLSTNGVCNGQLVIPGFTNWAPSRLTLSNVWIRLPPEGFQLTVTNDLAIDGASARLDLGGSQNTNTVPFDAFYNASNISVIAIGGSLTLTNGGRLTLCSAPTNAAGGYGALVSVTNDILITSNSWIYAFSNPTNGGSVLFRMRSLLIGTSTNGGINADASGFSRPYGPGCGSNATSRAGGGYGGQGRVAFPFGDMGGPIYGLAEAPINPGSSGASDLKPGGSGGGLVRIEARESVVVSGVITANGNGVDGDSGSGSGGGIYISCKTFGGTNGFIRANGGNGVALTSAGAGGGGRIAVIYNPADQTNQPVPSVRFSAGPGTTAGILNGDLGTIFFPDKLLLTEIIPHSGRWLSPGFTNWAPSSLTVSGGWFRLPAEGFQLAVAGTVRVDGASSRLDLGSDQWTNRAGFLNYCNPTSGPTFTVGGNLVLTNGGLFAVYCGMTNASSPTSGAQVSVSGSFIIGSNAWVYPYSHPTNGGSARFQVGNLFIAAWTNCGIDASARGCAGGGASGYGDGKGIGTFAGGGYGGRGKTYQNVLAGNTYGLSNAPAWPGSGGAKQAGSRGGHGGGLVWVVASDAITVGGPIKADGESVGGNNAAGSGGGIYLRCRTFSGSASGRLSAKGGTAGTTAGPGGGGRIAVWRIRDTAGGAVLAYADGGTNLSAYAAEAGTIVRDFLSWGTMIMVR